MAQSPWLGPRGSVPVTQVGPRGSPSPRDSVPVAHSPRDSLPVAPLGLGKGPKVADQGLAGGRRAPEAYMRGVAPSGFDQILMCSRRTPRGSLPVTQSPWLTPRGSLTVAQSPWLSPRGSLPVTQSPWLSPRGSVPVTQSPWLTPRG